MAGEIFTEPSLEDCKGKFIVIKIKDAKEKLGSREQAVLARYLMKIDNKNEYWIVNKDEPYAKQVEELIFGKPERLKLDKFM